MTNERAREVAKKIFNHAWRLGWTLDKISETETDILAYRDEVRREVLEEVRNKSILAGCVDARSPYQSDATRNGIGLQRRLFRDMLDEMIAETGPAETTAAINTSGDTVVIENGTVVARYPVGCTHPNHCAKYAPPYCAGLDNACPHAKAPAPPPSRDADLDTVWRTLAQAYVGNDYTIEGRKFQAAVERLWPR